MTEPLAAPADALCLDFANTRYWRGMPQPTEDLASPEALAAWCRAQGLAVPPIDGALHAEAIGLREAIFRLFAASAGGAAPRPGDVDALNHALAAAPARARLRCDAPGAFRWEVEGDGGSGAAGLLAPVLWSAGDLLAGPRHGRVRQCANPQCGWLFLDDSKSGNRRWCSMSSCGNRAKAHRHYARQKAAAGEPD